MKVQILKSKIHRVKVTGSNLDYIGSITIDKDLMDASNIIEGEKNFQGQRSECRMGRRLRLVGKSFWISLTK